MTYEYASYEGKGNNPFYYMTYIDPKWFFEPTIKIHKDCKEIVDGVCDDFCDVDNIIFPKGLIKIGEKSFYACRDLKKIILKEGLKSIGKYAFASCAKVERIELPSSLKTLGEGCFMYLDSLNTIRYHGTIEQWHKIKKGDKWNYGCYDVTVKCDDGKITFSNVERYSRHDSKGHLINKALVNDEIKEIVSLSMNERIKRAKGVFDGFFHYVANDFKDEETINYIIFGIPRLFISKYGEFKKVYYQRFQAITGVELSYQDFYELMIKKNDIEEMAFDIITCQMPISRRLNVVIVGSALVAENKRLNWNVRKLIKELIGPLGR